MERRGVLRLAAALGLFAVGGIITYAASAGGRSADVYGCQEYSTCPAIHVTKNGPAQAHHGDTLNFTYDVQSSNGPLENVSVTDDHCSPVSTEPTSKKNDNGDSLLDDGETWVYSCSYVAPSHSVGEENPIHDIATANASDDQGSQVSAQDSHDTDLLHPNISVAKQANVTTALVGDTITYTFTVTNPGDTPLSSVTVTDPRCDSGTLSGPSGDTSNTGKLDTTETWTYHCTHVVVASDSNPIHNVVTASGQDSLGGAAGTVTDSDQKDVSVLRPYTILGFFPPLPDATWKKGRTVPFKIALAMNGVRISDSEAAALLSPNCRVKISASGAFALAPTCMKYDSANDQFYFNMKLTKPGAETVTVTVSYPGTSSTTTKSIGPFTIF